MRSRPLRTDGVYKALTDMRVRTPWIEAYRNSQKSGQTFIPNVNDPAKLDLTPKSMSESYTRIVLPLAQDPWMLDTYGNASGQIRSVSVMKCIAGRWADCVCRLGALLMDLDALSGIIAYKHTGEGVTTVTAAVDRITIQNPWSGICDLELSGQVTYATGRSSMEVSCQIAKAQNDGNAAKEEDILLTCAFTMASLDPLTKKSVPIAPLKVESETERALFARGEENYKAKKARRESTITQKAPDAGESTLIHRMWMEDRSPTTEVEFQPNSRRPVRVAESKLKTAAIMQPQYRNRHNFMVFGGYLLRSTFELAFTCAAGVSHARPVFVSLDPSTFHEPVPVGSVLYSSAEVIYSEPLESGGTRLQVAVQTQVRNVEHEEKKYTGTFYYTFNVEKAISIRPESFGEYMNWLDGRRRVQQAAASLKAYAKAHSRVASVTDNEGNRMTE